MGSPILLAQQSDAGYNADPDEFTGIILRPRKDAEMEQVLQLAEQLGAAIAGHERHKALEEAEKAVENDERAKELTEQLRSQGEKIAKLEQEMKPIEPDDKRKLQELQVEIASHQTLKDFSKAQADYAEMMSKVNQKIQEALSAK